MDCGVTSIVGSSEISVVLPFFKDGPSVPLFETIDDVLWLNVIAVCV